MRHDESNLQIACVRWFRLQYPSIAPLLFSVPNGGRRDAVTGAILKAEGAVAGVSDLLLLLPNGQHHGLCIEMKTAKGRQSTAQKEWQKAVEDAGYRYVVVRSLGDFIDEVDLQILSSPYHELFDKRLGANSIRADFYISK